MTAGLRVDGPVIDYLMKEVSFSTCDNRFFGELEKEMLVPNNVNIYGKVAGATSLKGYRLRLEFPEASAIGYIRPPLSNKSENTKRVLIYGLEDLLNYDSYWWLPLQQETEFSVLLNLLPPFPDLNPLDLQISCRPDVVSGLEADVTTTIHMQAEKRIDNVFLKLSAPMGYPGIAMAITEFSGGMDKAPQSSVTVPRKGFPFPRLSLNSGEELEFKATTRITSNPSSMSSLRCQQDVLGIKLLLLCESTPGDLPCAITVLDGDDREIPVRKTLRSTLLQASAQIMYSPFSIRQIRERATVVISPAQ